MTDKDPKGTAQDNSDKPDDDIERLSKDEKMAFEKIISEISEGSDTPNAETETPESKDQPSNNSDDEQQPAPEDSTEEPVAADDSGSDELDDEQQAALDKIMAEINGDTENSTENSGAEEPQPEPAAEDVSEELDDEQQAALNKIMAEINGETENTNANSGAEEPQPEPAEEDATEELDDEQQAALDKIMAEINGAPDQTSAATEAEDAGPDADADPDELNDEQQAALDGIMAEINGDSGGGAEEPDTEEQPEPVSEESAPDLDDEQQAALDKIMAEINGGGDAEPTSADDDRPDDVEEPSQPTDNSETSETEEPPVNEEPSTETAQLTIEEFNDELNSLLSAAKKDSTFSDAGDGPVSKNKPVLEKVLEKTGEDPEDDGNPDPDIEASDASDEYALLHEVDPETDSHPTPAEKKRRRPKPPKKKRGPKKVLVTTAAVVLLMVCIGGGAYWYYVVRDMQLSVPSKILVKNEVPPDGTVAPLPGIDRETKAERKLPDVTTIETQQVAPAGGLPANAFAYLQDEIVAAREHVLSKMEEVKDLKAYYEKGIKTDSDKVRRTSATARVTSFSQAQKHRQIELGLRAIQRRSLYSAKLEVPIRELTSASEELLYLKRKTRLFETLNQGLSGLAIPEFKQEVSVIIRNLLKTSNELTIDHIAMEPPSLESVWNSVKSEKPRKPKKQIQAQQARDKKISQEICQGNFERKYLLTELTTDTAGCLSKWTGKDLYLNGLTRLSGEQARILSQWPGEWLSLNGLKELPPDAARHLSQWKGKRLSLNGLTRLSKRSTQHLSDWNGEQLEMVGLKSIGRWENYGTQLYLSEQLRRKLQVQ